MTRMTAARREEIIKEVVRQNTTLGFGAMAFAAKTLKMLDRKGADTPNEVNVGAFTGTFENDRYIVYPVESADKSVMYFALWLYEVKNVFQYGAEFVRDASKWKGFISKNNATTGR